MRFTTPTSVLALVFSGCVAAAACGGGDSSGVASPGDDAGGGGGGGSHDAAVQDTGPKVCVASCSSDVECQNSCPAPSTGTSCCDAQTKSCYTAASACKASAGEGGLVPPY